MPQGVGIARANKRDSIFIFIYFFSKGICEGSVAWSARESSCWRPGARLSLPDIVLRSHVSSSLFFFLLFFTRRTSGSGDFHIARRGRRP